MYYIQRFELLQRKTLYKYLLLLLTIYSISNQITVNEYLTLRRWVTVLTRSIYPLTPNATAARVQVQKKQLFKTF